MCQCEILMKCALVVFLPKNSIMPDKQQNSKKKGNVTPNLQDIIDKKKTEKQALLKLLHFLEKEIGQKKFKSFH